ncbi:PLP-dependent aminotransferase family protein [Chengkuizengella sediminis]|uniref:aminotransferase-like domain-containing protein n=1 Tax=Chengkuizengella sediminis TaxID=1885917 RepID=UPI001389A92B|nr:PLP-dependent aminotransferase family protein [Chengkuizengella sediminis]NDI34081.1 PLP-dependent aminotransferase family protein [Chengkuizengella sediminis]
MNFERFFPPLIHKALEVGPPGQWAPNPLKQNINLHAGYPHPNAIPIEDLINAALNLSNKERDLPFQYEGSPSKKNLKLLLKENSCIRGIHSDNQKMIVTAGSTQALDLTARVLLHESDLVALESPTYMEAIEIFRNYTSNFISFPMDQKGLDVDFLAEDLAYRRKKRIQLPKLIYTVPTFHNPTGISMELSRRTQLLKLAEEYDFLIVEDDAYGQLAFKGDLPPIKSFDKLDRVIYLSSLSKVVAPGLRIGWAVAPKKMVEAMSHFKKDADHAFSWAVTAYYLNHYDFSTQVQQVRSDYSKRLFLIKEALSKYMPSTVHWTEPTGGFFIWVHLPNIDTDKLLKKALAIGVSFIPGKHFFIDPYDGSEFLRLSFSYADEEQITKGIMLIASLLEI